MLATIVSTIHPITLAALSHPNIAVLLLALGGLLICVEFNAPGTVIPGAAGIFLVLLAAYILLHMPIRIGAVGLFVVSLLLLAVEVKLPTHGVAAIAGIMGLVLSLAGIVPATNGETVSWSVAIGAGIGFGGIATVLAVLGERARRLKIRTGAEAFIGQTATAQTDIAPTGMVLIQGELWQATLDHMSEPIPAGSPARIVAAYGLVLVAETSKPQH